MGGASFVSGLALWLTSLDAPRRGFYAVFYAVHHVGFWGFMLAGLMHYQGMVWCAVGASRVGRGWGGVGEGWRGEGAGGAHTRAQHTGTHARTPNQP